MAIAINADREVMDQMLFGPPQPQLLQYIQQTNQYFGNLLSDTGRQFVQHAQQVFARTDTHEAMEMARAVMRMSNVYLNEDIIYTVSTIDELQEAPDSMVRWIMCHPTLRQMYHDGQVDGYGSRYEDLYPNSGYGWCHPDYQQVYRGWIEPVMEIKLNEHGEEIEEWYDEHVEVLVDDDDYEMQTLLDVEAVSVISAHATVDRALADKRDPTSYYDNPIV